MREEVLMSEGNTLELVADKFTFRVPRGYYYAGYDTWVKLEGDEALVGMTDYLQTHMGDIAFVHLPAVSAVEQDDVLVTVESAKATVDVTSPASGEILAFNSELDERPELINSDPYGEGWIARVRLSDWEADRAMLLAPEAYFKVMQGKISQILARGPKPA
jgi:glycine cleavage system H protein